MSSLRNVAKLELLSWNTWLLRATCSRELSSAFSITSPLIWAMTLFIYQSQCGGFFSLAAFQRMYHYYYYAYKFWYFISKRIPHDWKNPIGYLLIVFFQLCISILVFQFIGCFVLLALGVFMFSNATVKIIKRELYAINKTMRRKKCRKNMYKNFSGSIRTHTLHRQLSGKENESNQHGLSLVSFTDWFIHFRTYISSSWRVNSPLQ